MTDLEKLRAEAEELGVKVDKRWGPDRLQDEIEAAQADPDEDELEEPEPAPSQPVVARVGGYVNRDDGRGWVLEEEG